MVAVIVVVMVIVLRVGAVVVAVVVIAAAAAVVAVAVTVEVAVVVIVVVAVLVEVLVVVTVVAAAAAATELVADYVVIVKFTVPDTDWNAVAQNELKAALNQKWNCNKAKNVILFIGDGMGLPTVTAARIYKGQKMGNPGEETKLAWETFPNLGLIKVSR